MVKILLNGCLGKMGEAIVNTSNNFPNTEIVAGIDKYPNEKYNFKVFKSTKDVNIDYDVIIDFSRPEALKDLLDLSVKNNKPIVLCSTGYSNEDLNLIEEISKVIPIFKSYNMSLGINLINSILKKIIPNLYENYDIEIIEKHHNQKVDSPSGTALFLADTIKEAIPTKSEYIFGRHGEAKREKNEIGIHAIRGGSIVGDHDVIFSGTGEIIQLSHSALSRDVFAVGALKAAEYMSDMFFPRIYDMEDLLRL